MLDLSGKNKTPVVRSLAIASIVSAKFAHKLLPRIRVEIECMAHPRKMIDSVLYPVPARSGGVHFISPFDEKRGTESVLSYRN